MKEVELGGGNIGTTKKGIGPAYSSKASRSGIRMHHLVRSLQSVKSTGQEWGATEFAVKFKTLVNNRFKRYGHFEYDAEAELKRYY